MTKKTKPCPICNVPSEHYEKIFHAYSAGTVPINIRPIPSSVFACEEHGWFAISEKIEDFLFNDPLQIHKDRLAKKVAEKFIPFDDLPVNLQPVESLD